MIFCDDSDLMRVQPYVFEQGVPSFEELHEVAGDEVVRDCRIYWLSVVPVFGVAGLYGVGAYGDTPVRESNFDAAKLNPLQLLSAAVYRVLGWHVLPLLASSVGGAGFVEMMTFYRSEYVREFGAVVQAGLEYNFGSGYEAVNRRSVAELQRLRR